MSRIAKRLYATDETFREVANLLYGDGAEELIAKLSPEQKKARRDETKRKIGYATNAAGAIAGPAAIYQAVNSRKTGGFFRDISRSGKVGARAQKIARGLDAGAKGIGSGKMKAGAAIAGGTMVGLQGANWAGDTIAAQALSAKKKDQKITKRGGHLVPVSKSEPGSSDLHIPTVGKLKRVAAKKAYESAEPQLANTKKAAQRKVSEGLSGHGITDQAPIKVGRKSHIGKSDEFEMDFEISKVDSDKRQVFGWASIVEMNGQPVVDLQGDYIDIEEIEKSAYDYVIKSRKGGDMHRRNGDEPFHAADMIESFLVTPEKKEKMGLPDSVPTGWWVGYKINDDEAWNLVKSGKRTGFSIHGRGQRTPVEI